MKPIKTKPKAKRNNGKFERANFLGNCSKGTANADLSNLRKPIDTSVSSLHQVTKLLTNGSDEVKAVLSYECDVVYECRICRSLFRSLVNFISHKRIYCREKYNIVLDRSAFENHDVRCFDRSFAFSEETERLRLEGNGNNGRILRSHVPKGVDLKKDLTNVIDMLRRKRTDSSNGNNLSLIRDASESAQRLPKLIDVNDSAIDQLGSTDSTLITAGPSQSPDAQIVKIENMLTVNKSASQFDERLLLRHSPVQAGNSERCDTSAVDNVFADEFVCPTCDATFSSKKTLTFHVKSLHTSCRVYYPCPCCLNTFANTWSVYRHLFKVHRKSNEQVRQLRPQIQGTAFRKDSVKGTTEDTVKEDGRDKLADSGHPTNRCNNKDESLTSMSRPKCRGHRRSTRKGAPRSLSQLRSMVDDLDDAPPPPPSAMETMTPPSSEVPMRSNNLARDDNQGCTKLSDEKQTSPGDLSDHFDAVEVNDADTDTTCIRVQAVTSLRKSDWDMINNEESLVLEQWNVKNDDPARDSESSTRNTKTPPSPPFSDISDEPIIIFTSMDRFEDSRRIDLESKRRRIDHRAIHADEAMDQDTREDSLTDEDAFVGQGNYTAVMESKIAAMANFGKLQCLLCNRKFSSMTSLRGHLAAHVGWYRYRCELCNFKSFLKCDLVAHCNTLHNAQNSRVLIEGMIARITRDECSRGRTIAMNLSDTEGNVDKWRVVDNADDDETRSSVPSLDTELGMSVSVRSEKGANNDDNGAMKSGGFTVATCQKSDGAVRRQTSSRLDVDSDLRRMVMEVIFGSSETDGGEPPLGERSCSNYPTAKAQGTVDRPDADASSARIELSQKEEAISLTENYSRPRRPVRSNRGKLLDEDFVYDVKEIAVFQGSTAFSVNKAAAEGRRSFVDIETENECRAAIPEGGMPKNPGALVRGTVSSIS